MVGSEAASAINTTRTARPVLIKEPKLLLNDDNAGKPEGIHLEIGRRPAFRLRQLDRRPADAANTRRPATARGSRCSCCTTTATREYAYGPAQGLPDTKVGTFTQALYDEAMKDGWIVVSMKNDWKRIFAFE